MYLYFDAVEDKFVIVVDNREYTRIEAKKMPAVLKAISDFMSD